MSTKSQKMPLLKKQKQTKSRRNRVKVEGERDRVESAECDYFGSSVDYPARGRPTQLTKPWKLLICRMETGGLSPAIPTWEQRPLTAGPPDRANASTHPKSVAPCLDTLMFHTNRFILSYLVLQSILLELLLIAWGNQ